MDISGCCEESHISEIEKILAGAETFLFSRMDNYGQVFDFTPEQEIEYYRRQYCESIESKLFACFMTKRSNMYKNKREVLELASNDIHIKTVRCMTGRLGFDPCLQFVTEVYDRMVTKGYLNETFKQIGESRVAYCRSATREEMKQLKTKEK